MKRPTSVFAPTSGKLNHREPQSRGGAWWDAASVSSGSSYSDSSIDTPEAAVKSDYIGALFPGRAPIADWMTCSLTLRRR